MDRVKTTYLLVAVNVLVVVFLIIFVAIRVKSGTGEGNGSEDGMRAATEQPGGARTVREGTGPAPEQLPPVAEPAVVKPRVASLGPGVSIVPQPERLPENTLEKVRETQWLLKELVLRCELYRSRYGAYPPSEIDGDNEINEGIESLYAHLVGDHLLDPNRDGDWVGNTDEDVYSKGFTLLGAQLQGEARLEILDSWGNPLIYFRHDRYPTSEQYRVGNGDPTPQVSQLAENYHRKRMIEERVSRKDVVEYHARDFVQIWSAGPNGENENGGGDDVTSWHIRE